MKSSKCRNCGEDPHYVEHIEKWYCFSCNSYAEPEEHKSEEAVATPQAEAPKAEEPAVNVVPLIAEELAALEKEDERHTCDRCGAVLQTMPGGALVCIMCTDNGTAAVPEAESAPSTSAPANAQSLIDSAIVEEAPREEPVEAVPEQPAVAAVSEPEPTPVAPAPAAKAEAAPAKDEKPVKMCPNCGQPLKWIEKYSRHYCYSCRKYATKESAEAPKPVPAPSVAQEPAAPKPEAKRCPDCGAEIKFIDKYNEWYCYTCKKYPLHKKKDAAKPAEQKPAEPADAAKSSVPMCSKCGKPLKHVEKYDRHYCYECKQYAPKPAPQAPAPAQAPKDEKKVCPVCSGPMTYVAQYNEWYCYKCKKYTLRPSKPVLLL